MTKKLLSETKQGFWFEARSTLFLILIALSIRILVLELFFVPTCSMEGTILPGDYIFSTKYSYGYSRYSLPFSPNLFSGRIFASQPEIGDVVIMRPPNRMEDRFIKRLIGKPGDHIKIVNDVLFLNDIEVKREFISIWENNQGYKYNKYKETLPNGRSYFTLKLVSSDHQKSQDMEFFVPEGKYFFMGDNRDRSNDSRYDLGYVPYENLIAKARFIIFSFSEFFFIEGGSIEQIFTRPWPWLTSFRFHRLFNNFYEQN